MVRMVAEASVSFGYSLERITWLGWVEGRGPHTQATIDHCTLGKSPQGTKVHFEVCFTASFKGKTVQCTMNELYRSGAMREAA